MNDPQPQYQFHESIKKKISEWRKNPNKGDVYISYGMSPFPWATLNCQTDKVSIPVPKSCKPYSSPMDWMIHYLEDQVSLVAEELNEKIYRLTLKGELVLCRRKEIIEREVEY